MFLKSENEMKKIALEQIGKSACGPTAIINVLNSLDLPSPSPEKILEIIPARLRNYNTSNLIEYLISRILAGTIHTDLINGLLKITNNDLNAKFFIISPYEDKIKFKNFIYKLFELKCSLIFTENLFLIGNDAWHHQMCYGIKDNLLYLTNPFETVTINQIFNFITNGNFMIIPKEHVLERKIENEDLKELEKERWENFRVKEQIVNIIYNEKLKKNNLNKNEYFNRFCDLIIPYGGLGGISVFCKNNNKEGNDFLNSFIEQEIELPFYDYRCKIIKLSL
jgi:phage pi2 protein 07